MAKVQGGASKPGISQLPRRMRGSVAIPVRYVSDRKVQAGAGSPIYVVSDQEVLDGVFTVGEGAAVPIQEIFGTDSRKQKSGVAVPVYFVDTTYDDRIRAFNPIAYFIGGETAGTTIVEEIDSPAQDGTYVGGITVNDTTGPDGVSPAPFWDGVNATYGDFYSLSLATAFDGNEGSLSCWVQVDSSSVWTDLANREIVIIRNNANNQIRIARQGSANSLVYTRRGSAVNQDITYVTSGPTDWFHVGMTWSVKEDEFILFFNGLQVGATQTGLGDYSAAPVSNRVLWGANSFTTLVWHGHLAQLSLFDYPLSLAQMRHLGTM